jgi:hypothetical protein
MSKVWGRRRATWGGQGLTEAAGRCEGGNGEWNDGVSRRRRRSGGRHWWWKAPAALRRRGGGEAHANLEPQCT